MKDPTWKSLPHLVVLLAFTFWFRATFQHWVAEPKHFPPAPVNQFEYPPLRYNHYWDIQNGMTYEQVAKIVPFAGRELAATEPTRTLLWKNPDGSALMVDFQDGKVVSKVQSGLR
jgi:hypothetical protein